MSNQTRRSGWEWVGPEPWRFAPLRDYDGPPPLPIETVTERFRPEDGWTVEHAIYVGRFDGETRWIPTTRASHPKIGSYEWYPIKPDRRARRQ